MDLQKATQWAAILIATVIVFAGLHFTQTVFAPLVLGLVIGVVLSPITIFVVRRGLPAAIGATATLLFSLVICAALLLFLAPSAQQIFDQGPRIMSELRESVSVVQDTLRGIEEASEEVTQAITEDGAGATPAEADPPANPVAVEEARLPTITDAILTAPAIAAQFFVFVGSLFFFELSRREIYTWISRKLTRPENRAEMERRLSRADSMVSRYFLTISLINLALGSAVAAAMAIIGMPAPVQWGIFAGLMNFILYLGPAVVAVTFLVAGFVVFDGAASLLPLACYVGCNIVESQFVTPMTVGRHTQVNPLLIFVALVFGLWLWGPVGGIIALPVLIWGLALAGKLERTDDDQTISSGTTGKSVPKSSAGAAS